MIPNDEKYRVSECFPPETVMRDGYFAQLDEVSTSMAGSLVYCQNIHYLELAKKNPNISAVLVMPDIAGKAMSGSQAVIVMPDPRLEFFSLYRDFYDKRLGNPKMNFGIGRDCIIHPSAVISPQARIGDRVEIAAHAVIGSYVRIMDDVYIGPNTVIGAEGLITLRRNDGRLLLIKHSGGVEIGNGTQILAGAIVVKSLFQSFTHIGEQCQIGIMANVGHGVFIGDNSVISGNTVIAGRTVLGRNVWVGVSSSIAQGLTIGDEAQIKMGSAVVGSVAAGEVVSGNFAVPHVTNLRHFFQVKKL